MSQWAIDDAGYDIAEFVQRNIVDEFAYQEGVAFVSGDGVGKPKGFLTEAISSAGDASRPFGTLQYVPSASASGIAPDSLVDLIYAVRSGYRHGDGVCFMMNSTTASVVRKMKDGNGQWLWQPSMTAGQPAQLLGFDVIEAEAMPNIAANSTPIVFGNFQRGYVIVDRTQDRILRDPYTVKGQINFYIARRVGGNILYSNALKLLRIGTN